MFGVFLPCMSFHRTLRSVIIGGFAAGSLIMGSHAFAAETSTLYRAPGLSADLTVYNLNGVYVTPQMAFSGMSAVTVPVSAPVTAPVTVYGSVSVAGQTFVPRNSNSAIVFANLPSAGTITLVPQTIIFNYSYRNPGFIGPFLVQQALFAPDQSMVGVSEETRSIATGASSAFGKPQSFSSTLASGTYTLRVRVYSADRTIVYDENSVYLLIKR